MHAATHAIYDAARYLWIAYAFLGVLILYLCWAARTRWAKRLLLLELAAGLLLGSTFVWFPASGHDVGYDLFGAFLWSGVALAVVAVTAILCLICREVAVSLRGAQQP